MSVTQVQTPGYTDVSVTTAKLANDAVTTAKIANGNVTPVKLSTGGPSWNTSGTLSATSFSGPLTGNVTGNVSGDLTGNVTGNVTGNLIGNATTSSIATINGAKAYVTFDCQTSAPTPLVSSTRYNVSSVTFVSGTTYRITASTSLGTQYGIVMGHAIGSNNGAPYPYITAESTTQFTWTGVAEAGNGFSTPAYNSRVCLAVFG